MISLLYLPCPMAYRRIRPLFDEFDYIHLFIWLSPGGTSSFVLSPLSVLDSVRVVPLPVRGVNDCRRSLLE